MSPQISSINGLAVLYIRPGLTKTALSPMTESPSFSHKYKATVSVADLACDNWSAFSWPSGDPYVQSGVFMVPRVASSELCVPVKCRGAG